MKTIGIMTSGGDAPGMNAAIRAARRIVSRNARLELPTRVNYGLRGFLKPL